MAKILMSFFQDLNEIKKGSHPFNFCDNCGKKKKLTYSVEGRIAWCNQCWKDWEAFDKQLKKEYGY